MFIHATRTSARIQQAIAEALGYALSLRKRRSASSQIAIHPIIFLHLL